MRDQTPYIEFHAGAREHHKIVKLAESLQVSYAHAVGLMACLWSSPHAMNHNGSLASCSNEFIASLAKWEGAVNGFVEYLQEAKLLDQDRTIHDYGLHGTRLLVSARARVQKFRANKAMKRHKKRNGNAT